MKKKIIFSAILALFLTSAALLTASASRAQGTDRFECVWRWGKCKTKANDSCLPGNVPDDSYCPTITSKNSCNGATSACIPSAGRPNEYWCDPSTKTKINTAIGCIPVMGTDGKYNFLNFVLRWAIGVGGGVAFLLIVYSGFMIMTASGNPERLQAGRELLTSAISGLILLIFSVFVLKFIGVDILGLNEFGFGT